jgi:hypothetical protein
MSWVATAIAGSAILGAGASIYGSQLQQKSTQQATNAELAMFGQGKDAVQAAQGNLSPFISMGGQAGGQLINALPGLTKSFNPTMQDLENTPGYQFTLGQGEKAVTNANSAMGLADSGVQGKGIANYAEGLASTTFQQQFENYLKQNQQKYNMLMGPTQLGVSAAGVNLGGAESLMGGGIQTGGQVGSNLIGAGNAGAAGALGVAGSGSNAMNQYMQYMMLQRLTGGGQNNAGSPGDLGQLVGNNQAPWGSGGYNFLDAAA